jgi:hypothetical protein
MEERAEIFNSNYTVLNQLLLPRGVYVLLTTEKSHLSKVRWNEFKL